jgi:formate dehydrogenase major subunit
VAQALGVDLGCPIPADALHECAAVAPLFGGLSHQRLDAEGALHWPCRSAEDPGEATLYLTASPRPMVGRHLERVPTSLPASSRTRRTRSSSSPGDDWSITAQAP